MATTTDTNAPTPDGPTVFQEVEGVLLPPKSFGTVRSMAEHVQQLRQMTLRDDDVFLLTYPKSGTHWLWEVCSMLRQGKADYETRTKVQLMMEFVDVEALDEQPAPRILNSHLPFSMLPVQEMRDKRTKIVHVYRNPKDVLVSMHFMMKSAQFGYWSLELGEFVQKYMSSKAPYGLYFDYLRQMHDFTQSNADVPVFSLSYEDMKKDPVSNIKRLAKFLEVDVSDKLCEEIAEACSFHRMKEFEKEKEKVKFGEGEADPLPAEGANKDGQEGRKKPVIYRKGETGDWKNYLTVAMSEQIDAMAEEKMKGLPFTLQYT